MVCIEKKMSKQFRLIIKITLLALTASASAQAYADPPPWAPAHGWRQKHDPYYTGYTGRQWSDDFGISAGQCNRKAVGTVVGGVVGGAVGSTFGNGDNRAVAIILGTILGSFIGHRIGQDLDNADRGCLGHALELGARHRPVTWYNPVNQINYTVTPLDGFSSGGKKCRNYTLDVKGDGIHDSKYERACLISDGTWKRYKG